MGVHIESSFFQILGVSGKGVKYCVHKTDNASFVLLFAFIIESRCVVVHGYRYGSTASDADVE